MGGFLAVALLLVSSATTQQPPPRTCDNQGFYAIGQPYPETSTVSKQNAQRYAVASIDRVTLSGSPVAYIYVLQNGHEYFSRRASLKFSDAEVRSLTSFLKGSDALHWANAADIHRAVTQENLPPYIRLKANTSAATSVGLSIQRCYV